MNTLFVDRRGITLKADAQSLTVQEAVEDRGGERGIAEEGFPVVQYAVGRDQGAAA